MTFNQFITRWNGKYLEVAGSANAKFQCVDLVNGYIRDVLGLPIIEWTNAVDFPKKAGDAYIWIPNTPTGIPKEGDIMVWKPSPGHIAVFIEGNIDSFRSFDENFPMGSPCHIQNHNYTNVTGWLRAKTLSPDVDLQENLNTCITNRDSHHNDRMAMYEELGFTGTFNLVVAVEEIKKLRNIDTQVKEKDEQLSEAQTEINDLKGMLDHYQKINLDLTEKATDLSERADELEKDYVKTSLNYREAMGRIEALQKLIDKPALTGWKKLIVDLISKL